MDYEKLGAFYLGRPYDLEAAKGGDGLLLYDSKDLVTHAVCVGMTGSGKTGLCVGLLEEAAIDGIPALVIDPKGDLGNLLLTFPELAAEDFRPWVNEDDARRKEISADELASREAETWRKGLESWGQSGERIRKLRDAADFSIYTPGSEAGLPVSILSSFAAPSEAVVADADLLRDRIASTATSLLGLLGIDADPIQSREHILLSNLLDHLWRQRAPVDLGSLIQAIQSPPLARVGVLDLESFFPSKERFKFAMQLNNLLAAPSFQGWLSGQPLDVGELLYTPEGKPRVAIFSIAHLSEPERMFFVSLLLNQTLSWMRSRPGTTSLRALLYMDEIFGYMPPVAEPPSKKPLLTLLKQARAYGLGVVLATQNPVDLDYKGLSNTGTWFIGRLQTERDKERVLAGLEGIEGSAAGFDRRSIERIVGGLGKRVFLLHNVHEPAPVVFETRWAMSYLRGPLTRQQIKTLMEGRKSVPAAVAAPAAAGAPGASAPATGPAPAPAPAPSPAASVAAPRPVLAPEISQVFLPAAGSGAPTYAPQLLGLAKVRYMESKTKREVLAEELALAVPLDEEMIDVEWDEARELAIDQRDLAKEPMPGAAFLGLPAAAGKAKSYKSWEKKLSNALYRGRALELWKSKTYKEVSEPHESERDFRLRLGDRAREERDERIEKLRKKHASKAATLEERIRKAQQAVEREREQASGQKLQTAISVGATLLAAFTGKKSLSYSTLSRATTAARGASRSSKEKQDVKRAEETVEALTAKLEELNAELQEEVDKIEERFDPANEELETVSLRPRRSDVEVRLVALGWEPV